MKHSSRSMAVGATLHCLAGCSIGEILGMVVTTLAGIGTVTSVAISISLSFVFGYSLSTLPLVRHGLPLKQALLIVLAADTLSILTMEITDNLVMVAVPGAMNAGLNNWIFWLTMPVSLVAAFTVAVPVNQYLLERGKGHALVHKYHESSQ